MPTNLVTAGQARALLPTLSAAEVAALPSFLAPATRAVEQWCRQSLGYGSWLEYHRPEQTRTIRLRNGYVIPGTVELRTRMVDVASLACVDPTASRATAALTTATLTLQSYSPSMPGPAALALASYPTLGALATAANAVPGWSLDVNPGYANWLVSDVEPNPGAMGALGRPAMLVAYVEDLGRWAMAHPATGIIEITEGRPQAFRFPDRAYGGFGLGMGYGGGYGSDVDPRVADVRCSYQAGFDPAGELAPATPDDLAWAVCLTIKGMLDSGQFTGVLESVELGNSKVEIGGPVAVPDAAKGFLPAYIKRSLG